MQNQGDIVEMLEKRVDTKKYRLDILGSRINYARAGTGQYCLLTNVKTPALCAKVWLPRTLL